MENQVLNQSPADIDAQFRRAMRRFAGIVTAITTIGEEGPVGLIATAVCSLSATPPSVIICVNRSASAHDTIVNVGAFGVNLLHPTQGDVVQRFGKERGASRFDDAPWNFSSGVPLLEGAEAAMHCRLDKVFDGFSHSIMVGIVEQIHFRGEGDEGCLLWMEQELHRPIRLADTASS
jgi:flavin reductase